jgi:hypothetical protein
LESDWSKVAVFINECSLQGTFPAIYLGCQATLKGALISRNIFKGTSDCDELSQITDNLHERQITGDFVEE